MDLKFHLVKSGSTHNSYGLCRFNDILQSFDFIDNHRCYGTMSTDFSYFCYGCYALTKLPDNLNISSGTDFSYFCSYCYALTKANIILPAAYNITTLTSSNKLTVASMRYIADHAPTTSSHTLTIGSTNIARANAYDPTIITTLTGKGWTVN